MENVVTLPIASTLALPTFESAAKAVLKILHEKLGFDLFMVTRTEGDDWIVLQSEDHGYGVKQEDIFKWSDSFCSRMVTGSGPRIAPCSASIPAYREAPIGRKVKIGAYVGVPLTYGDGRLFGTLCGIDPNPQPKAIETELPLVELFASLLSALLHSELQAIEAGRSADSARAEAEVDCMTGLCNRRGWNRHVEEEDARCRSYGHTASVVVIDLDGLKRINDSEGHVSGDRVIIRAGETIQGAVRKGDIVARMGGDEFAVLAPQCDLAGAKRLTHSIRTALMGEEICASLGAAVRAPARGLNDAYEMADTEMYREKSKVSSRAERDSERSLWWSRTG